MSGAKKLFKAVEASGGGGVSPGSDALIENVFSDALYQGQSGGVTVNNGIDLSGSNEGLVWIKNSYQGFSPFLFDTVRGATKALFIGLTNAENTYSSSLTNFNSNGFTIGALTGNLATSPSETNSTTVNENNFHSFTFKKANNFFHVSEVVCDANNINTTVDLSALGTVGMVWARPKGLSQNFICWHRGLNSSSNLGPTSADRYNIDLNASNSGQRNTGEPFLDVTGTTLTVKSGSSANFGTYIVYAWADNSSIDAENRLIVCSEYTGNNGVNLIDIGFEPEFVLGKAYSTVGGTSTPWWQVDRARGWTSSGNSKLQLGWNTAETTNVNQIQINSTGFRLTSGQNDFNANSYKYIYMAVRRGPMRSETSATNMYQSISIPAPTVNVQTNFRGDFGFVAPSGTGAPKMISRSINFKQFTNSNLGATNETDLVLWDFPKDDGNSNAGNFNAYRDNESTEVRFSSIFQNQRGVVDFVNYHQGASLVTTARHNLNVVPEIVIDRLESHTQNWKVHGSALGSNKYLTLDSSNGLATSTIPANTSTHIPIGNSLGFGGSASINSVGSAICFASKTGMSKVGTFSHTNGSTTSVSLPGFTAGARFFIIKRTDASGSWYWFNSAFGIVAGNDSYKLLDGSTSILTDDFIDNGTDTFIVQTGFTTGTYIFIAIA